MHLAYGFLGPKQQAAHSTGLSNLGFFSVLCHAFPYSHTVLLLAFLGFLVKTLHIPVFKKKKPTKLFLS